MIHDDSIKGGGVAVFNTESIYHYYTDGDYYAYIVSCNYIAIDGIGLKLALKAFKIDVPRFHGPDLLAEILAPEREWSVCVAGGGDANEILVQKGVVEYHIPLPYSDDIKSLAEYLGNELPHACNQYFRIYILISLGLPKQEKVAARLLTIIRASRNDAHRYVIVPIGAAIDFWTGTKVRSGPIWQKLGLEWLPRLLREPRMFPRILRSIIGIALLVKRELLYAPNVNDS